jgi:hypothetical protein
MAGLFEHDVGECASDVDASTDHPRPPEVVTDRKASASEAQRRSRKAKE